MSEVIDLTKTRTIEIKPKMTHSEMVNAYNQNIPIFGFIGGIELGLFDVEQPVPEFFPGSRVTQINPENGSEIEVPVLWSEYGRIFPSINDGKILLKVGRVDSNGNMPTPVSNEEFRMWASYWGINNLLTKSEFNSKIDNLDLHQ